MTEEQKRISLVSFLFFLGTLICVTYMGPDSLLKQFEFIIKRSRMTEEQKRISLVSFLFFLGTLICVTYMGPDSLLKHLEYIIHIHNIVYYSNLPNNHAGPFNRVGGRFLRN